MGKDSFINKENHHFINVRKLMTLLLVEQFSNINDPRNDFPSKKHFRNINICFRIRYKPYVLIPFLLNSRIYQIKGGNHTDLYVTADAKCFNC